MLTLLEVQGAIQELSRVKCTSVAGQIVISPASLQNNMIDSWIDLNKNVSNLIFSPSEIAIPKSFYQEFFCHLIHLFADFSGGLAGQPRVTELHLLFTDQKCTQCFSPDWPCFCFSLWIYGVMEVWSKRYNTNEINC